MDDISDEMSAKSDLTGTPRRVPLQFSTVMTLILMTVLGLISLKLLVVDPGSTPLKRERLVNGTITGIQYSIDANFAKMITLIGYDLTRTEAKSGTSLSADLYWKLTGDRITTDYTTVITLRDLSGDQISQATTAQPGGLATRHWRPGTYLQQSVTISIPQGTPPGQYILDASLYDASSGRSLDQINAAGNPEDVWAVLNTVTVLRPDQPPESPLSAEITPFNDVLALVQADQITLPSEVAPGQGLRLEWEWLALKVSQSEQTAKLVWMEAGEVKAESAELPLVDEYPAEAWQTGDRWRGVHQVYVPGDLESGTYQVAVMMDETSVNVGTMHITAPERTFTQPATLQHPLDISWQNGLHLRGYDVTEDGSLTLYWQTDQPLHQSLSVFVHMVNPDGVIVDQSAGVPMNYTRPTTGWAVGEVIADTSSVKFPVDATLEVRVGWYDPANNGQRVKLSGSDADYIVLSR